LTLTNKNNKQGGIMTVLLRVTILLAIAAAILTGCGGNGAKDKQAAPENTFTDTVAAFTDSRDGKTYKKVKIGSQVWMAENLNFAAEGSVCYDSSESNCATYGRLYVLDAAKASCPAGWHLPSTDEWDTLITAVGVRWQKNHGYGVYSALKAAGGWRDDGGKGDDKFGFSALPGGGGQVDDFFNCNAVTFSSIGVNGEWWSTDRVLLMEGGTESGDGDYVRWFDNGLASVRCLRDDGGKPAAAAATDVKDKEAEQQRQAEEDLRYEEAENARKAKESITTFTDSRDGKTYKRVTIGGRKWMAQSLNYAADGSKCYENNAGNCEKYGRLYDWATAQKVCPAGYHLPSDAEWTALTDAVGGEDIAGLKFKSTAGWNEEGSSNGTNDYGFLALPGGYWWSRDSFFSSVGLGGYWWSATEAEDDAGKAQYWGISNGESVNRGNHDKSNQFSVRCVQDQ
jgi:uncharacterized protein (TIGR02145 family)